MRNAVLAQDLKVTVWQWPQHRVLWGKRLPKEWRAEVVCEGPSGAMICSLQGTHYFVLWPENVLRAEEGQVALSA